MRLDYDSLSRMTIDPLTASEIGWGRSARRVAGRKTPAADPMRVGGGRWVRSGDRAVTEVGQFASIGRPVLARVLARFAASEARRASAYLARGAECDPSP